MKRRDMKRREKGGSYEFKRKKKKEKKGGEKTCVKSPEKGGLFYIYIREEKA